MLFFFKEDYIEKEEKDKFSNTSFSESSKIAKETCSLKVESYPNMDNPVILLVENILEFMD